MKTAGIALGALMTVCRLHAALSVDWISDSSSSFDVTLCGTGPGWTGTITSPSGLWQLSSANIIDYSATGMFPSKVFVDNTGVATFMGSLSPQLPEPDPSTFAPFNTLTIGTYGGYQDYFSPVAPINDRNSLGYGYLAGFGWNGMSTISVTSLPNLFNESTWTWTANYSACGLSLEAPEPNTISFGVLAVALGMAYRLRKRLKRDGLSSGR